MKTACKQVLIYGVAIVTACILAGLTTLPILKPGDFSVGAQILIIAVLSGFYIVTFAPLVIIAHILLRKVRTNLWLPLSTIPTFGVIFPWLGKLPIHFGWWPEEPGDMKLSQFAVYSFLALFSISLGVFFTFLSNKRQARKGAAPGP